jgi:hypothetical protein
LSLSYNLSEQQYSSLLHVVRDSIIKLFFYLLALEKDGWFLVLGAWTQLTGAGILGANVVLVQRSEEHEPPACLDLPGGDGRPLVIVNRPINQPG